jgi:hypothetical protein
MPRAPGPRTRLRRWLLDGRVPQPESTPEAWSLAATAQEQGLGGLLDSALTIGGGSGWPAEVRQRLRDLHRVGVARGLQQLDVAVRVQALLERQGIRTLALKGIALAELAYDSLGERPMADVDLLVLGDFAAAADAMARAGVVEMERADHAWSFQDPGSGVVVELHRGLTSCPRLFPVDGEGGWARGRVLPGTALRAASVEDLLVHMTLHAAFQHGLGLTLIQWLDFRRAIERGRPDAALLWEIAARTRAEDAAVVAFTTAAIMVGAPFLGGRTRRVPPRLRWLSGRLREPECLLPPAAPPVGRLRWSLASGRRLEWIRTSVAPRGPDGASVPGLWPSLLRAARLARSHGRETLRSWRA